MTIMRIGGIKSKLQKLSFSPSKPSTSPEQDKKQEKPKSMNYKQKMKQRYNLSDSQFEDEKRIAQKQLKNWEDHRKEQVLQIFQSNCEYVSKSKKSDVRHPKMAKANVVLNSKGEKVEVEFGRLREFYLYTLAPCKEFISIRDHTAHEKALEKVRQEKKDKKKSNFVHVELTEEKKAIRKKKNTEYALSKSVYEAPDTPQKAKTTQREKYEAEDTAPIEKFVPNTTDEKHAQFPETWYHQSMTRTKLKPGKMNYWLGNEEDDDMSVDDDPEGKYAVTAERLIETLTSGGKVKDSGVTEPAASKTALTDPLSSIFSTYKKTCGKEANYLNTLKGTIDFVKNQNSTEPTASTNTITQDDATDAPNQITFASTIVANVFNGKRLKRQYASRKDMESYEENRKDYTREAGEETSGL